MDEKERREFNSALGDICSEEMEKLIRQYAKSYFVAFTALKAEGFDSKEALQITIKRGPFLHGGTV